MYNRLNCHECLNYEYDDPTLENNCIHYRFCIKNIQKTNNEIEREWVNNIQKQIDKYKQLRVEKTVSVATFKNILNLLEETIERLQEKL